MLKRQRSQISSDKKVDDGSPSRSSSASGNIKKTQEKAERKKRKTVRKNKAFADVCRSLNSKVCLLQPKLNKSSKHSGIA